MIETLQKSRYGPMIVRRHRNRPIEEWGALLADVPGATAILDRLLEGAEIVRMQGLSYRLRNAAMMAGGRKKAGKPENPTEMEAGDLGRSTGRQYRRQFPGKMCRFN